MDMTELYSNEERKRLAAVAHARACWCPETLSDWEERVADKCCTSQEILEAIQTIDLRFRSGLIDENRGIELLRQIEAAAEKGSPIPIQAWFARNAGRLTTQPEATVSAADAD